MPHLELVAEQMEVDLDDVVVVANERLLPVVCKIGDVDVGHIDVNALASGAQRHAGEVGVFVWCGVRVG